MSDSETQSARVLELAEEFLERHRRGERPTLREYIDREPALADQIKSVFPAMAMMEDIALADESLASAATDTVILPRTVGDSPPRAQLGDYRIIREVGRGGMGVVYEAEQISLGRHVALKVLLRQGLGESSHLQRFLFEARAAARLHHTNIVPVFGVGDQDGVHYYAMQFIQGRGLDVVLAELRAEETVSPTVTLSESAGVLTGQFSGGARPDEAAPKDAQEAQARAVPGPGAAPGSGLDGGGRSDGTATTGTGQASAAYYRSAARVGRDVAGALAYAHSQGILHRDIKPSNLLLDADGTIWVTDFGLAKAEGTDALTDSGAFVGTLRYMAPERFEGWSDPKSDVYSLGATLYELITLRPLFDESNRAKLIKMVAHESPVSPRKLNPEIPRDLETIVLKAIAREPAERYATAEQMADDLERFLADRPILARRSTALEHLRRWARRNPALAGSLAALFLSLAIGCASMTLLWRRAEIERHRADSLLELSNRRRIEAEANQAEAERQHARAETNFVKARGAVDELLTKVSESQLSSVPGLQPLRRDLLNAALTYYQDFVSQRGDDPALKSGLAAAQLRLGRILYELGEDTKSRAALEQALALHEAALRDRPGDHALQHGLAQCYFQLGVRQMPPDGSAPPDAALRQVERAISLWESLVQAEPKSVEYSPRLANAYDLVTAMHDRSKKLPETLRDQERAFALRQAMVEAHPDDPSSHSALAATLNNLGALLHRTSSDVIVRMRILYQSAEHARIAYTRDPGSIKNGRNLTIPLRNIASNEHALGHFDLALAAAREALKVTKRLVAENPAIPSLKRELVDDYHNVGGLLRYRGRTAEMVRTFRECRELEESLPRESGDDWYYFAGLLALCARPAVDARAQPSAAEQAECRRHADAAIAAIEKSIAAGFHNAELIRIDDSLSVLRDRDDFRAVVARVSAAASSSSITQSTAPRPSQPPSQPQAASPSNALGRSADRPIGGPPERQGEVASGEHAIGIIQLELGRFEEARATLGRALALRQAQSRAAPREEVRLADLAATRLALGRLDWKAGRLEAAVQSWDEVRQTLESAVTAHAQDPFLAQVLVELETTVGHSYAEAALWDEASAALARAVQRGSRDLSMSCNRASLLALTGDRDGLRVVCNSIVDDSRTGDSDFASDIARWCALAPGIVPDAARLVALAEPAAFRHDHGPERLFCLALTEYRAERFDEAIRRARESMTGLPKEHQGPIPALDEAVLAMAHHKLRHTNEAKAHLDEISRIDWRSIEGWPEPQNWWQRSDFLVLKREAIELLTGKPAPEDPWLHRRRGEAYTKLGQSSKADAEFRAAESAEHR
jgi:serine/threonine protein kinase